MHTSTPPKAPTPDAARVEAKPADAHELGIPAARLSPQPKYWFDHAVGDGSVCYIGRNRGEIIGNVFANQRAIILVGKELARLPGDVAYIYNTYIFEEFRGRGLYTNFLAESRAHLGKGGCRYIASLVDRENLPSIGPGRHFGTRRERAPVVFIPGLWPIVLGKGFRMLKEVAMRQ